MSFMAFGVAPWHAGTVRLPTTRGLWAAGGLEAFSRQSLPGDSVGTFSLTLTNLVVGSAIRIEVASTGAEVATRTAASSTEVFSVPAYAPGSASNDLRIKVRKGSASPYYRPFETLATALVGSASIYVAQIQDD